jgi:hypothetical protein
LGYLEQGVYLLLELFGEQYPLDAVADVPLAVNDDRERERLALVKETFRPFRAERDGVVDSELSGEAPDLSRSLRGYVMPMIWRPRF